MSANKAGPYEIDFLITGFTAPAREHRFRPSVVALGNPTAGTAATAIDIQKAGGGTAKLNVVANQIWEYIRLFYPSGISCTGYTLWKYVTGTDAKDYISAGTVTNPAGTGAAIVAAYQVVLTYRSALGGIMKQVLLETNQAAETRTVLVANAAGTPSQKLAAYVMSADNVIFARDDSYPITPLRQSFGQNERVWRLIYRGT